MKSKAGFFTRIKRAIFNEQTASYAGGVSGIGGAGILADWENDDKPRDANVNLGVVTFYACVRNISEDIAKLPKRFIRNEVRGTFKVGIPFDDDLSRVIFDAPNPKMTGFVFWSLLESWELIYGNAYALEKYDARGNLIALWPIHPTRIWPRVKDGRLVFDVYSDDGRYVTYLEEELFRLWGLSSEGRIGYNPAYLLQMTTGLAHNAKKFANAFFNNGARPSGVMEMDETLGDRAMELMIEQFATRYAGAINAGKIPLLQGGVKYKALAGTMEDLQFNELNEYTDEEIARFYRMPLYKLQRIKGAQGWSTLDAQETDYASSCLVPRITSIEQQIKRQLMYGYPENVWPHIEVKGLMRGDVTSRQLFYNCLFVKGCITRNEIRVLEDLIPSTDPTADKFWIQQGFIPTDMVQEVLRQPAQAAQGNNKNDSNAPDARLDGVHSNGTENAALLRNGTGAKPY